MWCMFAAPLLMSNDLRSIDKKTVAMLTNREVIAIDQDALGASAEGTLIVNNTNIMSAQVSVWHKPLANGDVAVALLNMGVFDASTYNLTYTAAMLGLDDAASYKVRDLWTAQDAGVFRGSQSVWLEPAEVLMLRFSKSTAHENEPRRKILKTDDISAFEAFEREAAKPSPPHGGCNELSPALGSHMVLQQAPAAAVLFGTVCGKVRMLLVLLVLLVPLLLLLPLLLTSSAPSAASWLASRRSGSAWTARWRRRTSCPSPGSGRRRWPRSKVKMLLLLLLLLVLLPVLLLSVMLVLVLVLTLSRATSAQALSSRTRSRSSPAARGA